MRGRANVICPRCESHDRHRAIWLYLKHRTDLFESPLAVLHFAPEAFFQERLRAQRNLDYLSADLDSPLAMRHFDITDIPFPDRSFDVILCSHVLEHVDDDRRAMGELLRILRPGGWALVLVPIDYRREETYDDPAITAPEDREREFWQDDHVRLYGRDFAARLREAGFQVEVDPYIIQLDAAVRKLHGLSDHRMYIATSGELEG